MSDLRDLYQEVIFDHNRNPRNFGKPDAFNRTAEGFNPLCGDEVTLYLRLDDDGVIQDIGFDGHGCAISTASASIMTEILKGKTEQQAGRYFEAFHAAATGEGGEFDSLADADKLEVLRGVCDYPARVKCATLPWHTVNAALKNLAAPVTTE